VTAHIFVPDRSHSIVHGPPLDEEPGLGTLTLPGFLREVTARFAGHEALVQQTGGVPERWSYADLWSRSVGVAKALVARGLGKGERVGVLMTNRAEFLTAMFGTALAGGVGAPLSTFSTADELDYLVATSSCSMLLIERHVLKKDFGAILCAVEPEIGAAPTGGVTSLKFPFLRCLASVDGEALGAIEAWRAFLAPGETISDEQIEARAASVMPADPGALFFSSGSTNKPKGILSSQRGVALQCWRLGRQQRLAEGVRSWAANGFFFSGNFANVIGGTLAMGGALVLQRTFQAKAALDLMQAEKVSYAFAWPHQWAQLVASPNWATTDLSAMHFVDTDGPIARHPTIRTDWIEPRHCYGNTETFTISTAYPANTSRADAHDSHGLPWPGNILKIVDPLSGATVPVGMRGEIAIKGPTLMLGYVGVPLDETLDAEGFFRTGDGGQVDAAGRLFWQGRLSDIIKTGGANVSPLEIDDILRTCPGVKVVQTVGVPDEMLGEIVVSCVVPVPDTALDEAVVRGFAKEKLASFKVPRRVLFFTENDLSMTGTAKIKTSDLRDLAARTLAKQEAA
jgi:fatty-acyl-CoA synthase